MADLAPALEMLLAHEGPDSRPPDAETRWGIRQVDLDEAAWSPRSLADVTRQVAEHFWTLTLWHPLELGTWRSQALASKYFDLAAVLGTEQATRSLQRAARACGHYLRDDGILGPFTRQAANTIDELSLLPALRSEAAASFRLIIAAHPAFETFRAGWLRRAYD